MLHAALFSGAYIFRHIPDLSSYCVKNVCPKLLVRDKAVWLFQYALCRINLRHVIVIFRCEQVNETTRCLRGGLKNEFSTNA